ncbi:bifunctional nuclease family protein [bacterium]|nr:bifunctional nuclease family protein [bacterium]
MAENDLIPVDVTKIALTSTFCAVVLGNDEKEFPIYIEPAIGAVIKMFIEDVEKPRPLTHDLIGNILTGLNATVVRVVINDLKDNTYFARLLLKEENELGKKIVEIDSRPSDCMAIAKMKKCPIFVTRKVFDAVGKPPA